jgi:hypothetical protein
VVFGACVTYSVIVSTVSDGLEFRAALGGTLVLAIAHLTAWMMKRSRHKRSHAHSGGEAQHSRPTRAAKTTASTVRSDFAIANEARAQHSLKRVDVRSRGPSSARTALKWTLRGLAIAAVVLPLAAVGALWLCFSDQPIVVRGSDLSMDSYEKVQQVIEDHDPRNSGRGGVRTLVATQDELNILLAYGAKRFHDSSVRVALRPGKALVQASVQSPWSPFGQWLNFDAVLRESDGMPAIDRLTVGSLPVPGFVADFALEQALARFGASERGRIAKEMV